MQMCACPEQGIKGISMLVFLQQSVAHSIFFFFPLPKVSQWVGSAKAQSAEHKDQLFFKMYLESSSLQDDWQKHGTLLDLHKSHCCLGPQRQGQGGIAHFAGFFTCCHSKDLLVVWDQFHTPSSVTGIGKPMFLFHTLVSSSLRNFFTMRLSPD